MQIRHVKQVIKSRPTIEGAGVHLHRAIGFGPPEQYDPFVIEGKGLFCHQADPFSYETLGANYFDIERERLIGNAHLVFFGDGDAVSVVAEDEPVRFLLISGKPIREPIAWMGPIVMNTQAELRTAFEELERDTFIKDRGVEVAVS